MSRTAKRGVLTLGYLGAAAALMVAYFSLPLDLRFSPILQIGVMLAITVLTGLLFYFVGRTSDEVEREVENVASRWGGGGGFLTGLIGMVIARTVFVPSKLVFADLTAVLHGQWPQQPLDLMILGALVVLLTSMIGDLVARAVWLLR